MRDINIERPTITIVELTNGKTTYEVTVPKWQNTYTRRGTGTRKSVQALAKKFEQSYDKEATMIEKGLVPPHNIMKDLVDNNLFTRVHKLPEGFTC